MPGDMVTVAGIVKVVNSEEGWSSLPCLGLLQTDSIYRHCEIIGRAINVERFKMYMYVTEAVNSFFDTSNVMLSLVLRKVNNPLFVQINIRSLRL